MEVEHIAIYNYIQDKLYNALEDCQAGRCIPHTSGRSESNQDAHALPVP